MLPFKFFPDLKCPPRSVKYLNPLSLTDIQTNRLTYLLLNPTNYLTREGVFGCGPKS